MVPEKQIARAWRDLCCAFPGALVRDGSLRIFARFCGRLEPEDFDAAIAQAMKEPETIQKLHLGGCRVTYLGPADFRQRIATETAMAAQNESTTSVQRRRLTWCGRAQATGCDECPGRAPAPP